MRTLRISLLALVAAVAFSASVPSHAALSNSDRDAITATVLDYAEGWYEGSGERMERALHPELAKRRARVNDNGESYLDPLAAADLASAAGRGYGTETPEGERQADVEIYDVFGDVASVKLTMRDWVDYMHLAKVDGHWVIVNVLWDMKPDA